MQLRNELQHPQRPTMYLNLNKISFFLSETSSLDIQSLSDHNGFCSNLIEYWLWGKSTENSLKHD